jgi:hypothetical protein
VEYLGCTATDRDRQAVPSFAKPSSRLEFWALDAKGHVLPTIGSIWDAGVKEGLGRYLVYMNVDIGVQPDFYVRAHELLSKAEAARTAKELLSKEVLPWTALEFTRVQSLRLKEPSERGPLLDAVLSHSPVGRHPGHDCFICPRHMVPAVLRTGGLVVGMPPWGTMYHYALSTDKRTKLLFLQGTDRDRFTFHTGVEVGFESVMAGRCLGLCLKCAFVFPGDRRKLDG